MQLRDGGLRLFASLLRQDEEAQKKSVEALWKTIETDGNFKMANASLFVNPLKESSNL